MLVASTNYNRRMDGRETVQVGRERSSITLGYYTLRVYSIGKILQGKKITAG